MNIRFRKLRRNTYQAVVTDEAGRKWVWPEPIYERVVEVHTNNFTPKRW